MAALGLDQPFAVVTPCNPGGRVIGRAANAERLAAGKRRVAELAPAAVAVEGRSLDGAHREPGWAILVPQDHAIALAREWEQLGIYWWDGRRFRIILVEPSGRPGATDSG